MSVRPDTFLLTLPDGKRVRCWRREAELIRRDVHLTGTVILVKDPASEVYSRVAPESADAAEIHASEGARRIG